MIRSDTCSPPFTAISSILLCPACGGFVWPGRGAGTCSIKHVEKDIEPVCCTYDSGVQSKVYYIHEIPTSIRVATPQQHHHNALFVLDVAAEVQRTPYCKWSTAQSCSMSVFYVLRSLQCFQPPIGRTHS